MAKDYFTSRGLNTPKMMAEAVKYRHEFDMAYVELVDIVSILEFRLVERYPNFRLAIRADAEMQEDAVTEPHLDRITVRRSVYIAACEDDVKARFTLAHELGHFLLHREKQVQMHKDQRGAVQEISRMTADESIEDQADMFARHFLAPPSLAFKHKDDPEHLAAIARIPLIIARGNITMSKRRESCALRNVTGPRKDMTPHG
ncbi:ImmA/IrrE family metallo-endopeptidase [Sinorhizobium medicae]|uniref:ImmA/IrrE family metallo-endopeptidase n=1 Tax=Sinorhizobium medicae TaxID=110321 RepID=UPI000FD6CF10|nr:ImmA/IrrE family metallo-endopeptidase [Sinorhizobium medicae]RVI51695.1 ImmA/IrrE family metallo-endopeptidase [Sinorhizobium medicae]